MSVGYGPILTMQRSQVTDAAVVGVASEQWGQKVAAVVVLDPAHAQSGRGGKTWGPMDMRRALKDKLANYKIPQEMKVVDELPKNAMGKSKSGYPSPSNVLTFVQSIRRAWSSRSSERMPEPILFSKTFICTYSFWVYPNVSIRNSWNPSHVEIEGPM